jgi:hypothetical protein
MQRENITTMNPLNNLLTVVGVVLVVVYVIKRFVP